MSEMIPLAAAKDAHERALADIEIERAERLKEWLGREGGGSPEVKVLRALMLHALLDAPELLETGELDAAFLLMHRLVSTHIDAKLKEAGEPPSIYDIALWELKLCAVASIDILAESDERPRAKELARKQVCKMAAAGGFALSVPNMKKFPGREMKKFRAVEILNPALTVEGQKGVLRAVAERGIPIEDVIAGAIKQRARIALVAKAQHKRV